VRSGYTREQLEQFAKKYEKLKTGPAGPGREIEVKPGEESKPSQPSPNLPGFDRTRRSSSKNITGKGTVAQDSMRENLQGARYEPPTEFRGKWEGFKSKLGRSKATSPARSPAPPRIKSEPQP
jgi:hypothetical protein